MRERLRRHSRKVYERTLEREIDETPSHIAIIQDGNRRYARQSNQPKTKGYTEGAKTTAKVLEWCRDLDIDELTLYAFSTENFDRPAEEKEQLFDLLAEKLRQFADQDEVHDDEARIRAIGDVDRLPPRVCDAVEYAERRTDDYDNFTLNVALAYGGRSELLDAARDVTRSVADGDLEPDAVDVAEIERRLYDRPMRDVDLVIRTGGDERTSNFLPWHGNGSEAAVFFCAPYWPEFSKVDLLRAVRTYEHREESWRRTRARRALALVRALGDEVSDAAEILRQFSEDVDDDGEDIRTFEESPAD